MTIKNLVGNNIHKAAKLALDSSKILGEDDGLLLSR